MSRKKISYSVKKQSGSALILAIFIIVVMSLLAASLASLQRDSAEGTSYEVYAARAYLAAYSASEIAVTELLAATAEDPCDDVTDPSALPDDTGFHGCSVTNACTETPASTETDIDALYKIVSTAVCGSNQIITRRQLTVGATISTVSDVGECLEVYFIAGDDQEYFDKSVTYKNLNNAIYVTGDVSITGNINSNGDIYATGNVTVDGNVNASIYAGGYVTVVGNVNSNSVIYAGNYVKVGKNVNSSIYSGDYVNVGGNLNSGTIYAQSSVTIGKNVNSLIYSEGYVSVGQNNNGTIYATDSNKAYEELSDVTITKISTEEIKVCWTLADGSSTDVSTSEGSANTIYRLQTFD